jgi:hypothetical protein
MADASIIQKGAAERESLANAAGSGMSGTDVTGGQGVKNETTTKSLLGG